VALACAMLDGAAAIVPCLVVVAVMALAVRQVEVVGVTTVGLGPIATSSSSVQIQLVLVTEFARTAHACVAPDIVVNHAKQVSGAVMACVESMEHAMSLHIIACVVVVGLDRGATFKRVCV